MCLDFKRVTDRQNIAGDKRVVTIDRIGRRSEIARVKLGRVHATCAIACSSRRGLRENTKNMLDNLIGISRNACARIALGKPRTCCSVRMHFTTKSFYMFSGLQLQPSAIVCNNPVAWR